MLCGCETKKEYKKALNIKLTIHHKPDSVRKGHIINLVVVARCYLKVWGQRGFL